MTHFSPLYQHSRVGTISPEGPTKALHVPSPGIRQPPFLKHSPMKYYPDTLHSPSTPVSITFPTLPSTCAGVLYVTQRTTRHLMGIERVYVCVCVSGSESGLSITPLAAGIVIHTYEKISRRCRVEVFLRGGHVPVACLGSVFVFVLSSHPLPSSPNASLHPPPPPLMTRDPFKVISVFFSSLLDSSMH